MSSTKLEKSSLLVAILLLVEALACTQIPLLNYLGYEFSFLNALVAGFLCGFVAISRWKKRPPESDEQYWIFVWKTIEQAGLLILVPLIVISANAALVKNCSFTQGFRLYILYVVPAVVFCISLATFSAALAARYKKTLYVLLFILVLAQIPFVTLTRPQIFAFNPIAGYFPGFSYDESITGEMRLLVYRISTVAASALLLTVGAIVRRKRTRKHGDRLSSRWPLRYVALVCSSLVICVGLYRISDTIGLSSSERSIASELGGIQLTQHFNIIYPRKSVDGKKLRELVLLHEYLFAELCDEWRVNPGRAITVIIYDSPQQKERLIGAAGTDFTKPWLRQININLADVEPSLKHEMVHALLAERGIPFLQIAPNSGLIEGAAVAAERYEYDESIHKLAAEISALGLRPNVAGMFSASGFFKSYPGVSYVLAGSFCRYLIDRYGVEKFKKVYRSANFEGVYGKNLDALVATWQSVIGPIQLNDRDLEKAAYFFKRPPVFGKECARVIANLNLHTRQTMGRRDYTTALASAGQSLRLSKSVEAVFQKSVSLFRLGKFKESADFMKSQFADSAIRPSLLPLRLTLGDSYWALGDIQKARTEYSEILADSLSLSMNESASLRLLVLGDHQLRTHFANYFLGDMPDSMRMHFLDSLQEIPAADPLARYLLGREYAGKNLDREVVEQLHVLAPMKTPILEYLRNRRLARALYDLGSFERAKVYGWRALNFVHNEAQTYQLEDFLRRCDWVEDYLKSLQN